MSVPARPFRGRDQQDEGQINPVYVALAGRLSSDNLAASAVMPISTAPGTGTEILFSGGNMGWDIRNITFASSTTVHAATFTHSLGRTPFGYMNILYNPFQVYLAPASTGQWNSTAVIFGVASDTVTNSYRILLM